MDMGEEKIIRLLIVEDNVADVLLMREALREFCPFPVEITTAEDGQSALSILQSGEKFSVIILDLNMPKIDGFVVLEQSGPTVGPIIVFTSSWSDKDSKRALALGAREFIRKPNTYDGYVEAVCGVVERWAMSNDAEAAI